MSNIGLYVKGFSRLYRGYIGLETDDIGLYGDYLGL